GDLVGRLAEAGPARAVRVAVAGVVAVAVVLTGAVGDARRQLLADDGQVDHGLHLAAVVVAGVGLDVALELPGGVVGGDIEGAPGGVAAKQGALGAPQDLHLLDVEHVEVAPGGASVIHPVDVGAHRCVGGAAGRYLGHAPHGDEHQGGGAGVPREDRDGGGGAAQVGDFHHLGLEEHVFVEGGDRHRGLLKAFLRLAGGDGDF